MKQTNKPNNSFKCKFDGDFATFMPSLHFILTESTIKVTHNQAYKKSYYYLMPYFEVGL